MLAMIDKGEPHEAHPAYWAPFVVVGEGSTGRGHWRAGGAGLGAAPPHKKRRLLPSRATRGMSPGQWKFGGTRQTKHFLSEPLLLC